MHRGVVGAGNLNQVLQEALNPTGPCIERGARKFRVNDKVMQIRNNYDKEVFNGDIGRVVRLDQEMRELIVRFDGRDGRPHSQNCSDAPADHLPGHRYGRASGLHLREQIRGRLPLYRQEQIFARIGAVISRATMSGWMLLAADACKVLMEMMTEELRYGDILNMDETTVQVLREPERENTAKSFMWVARGGLPGSPIVTFHYDPSRGGKVAEYILGDFKGYLQTEVVPVHWTGQRLS